MVTASFIDVDANATVFANANVTVTKKGPRRHETPGANESNSVDTYMQSRNSYTAQDAEMTIKHCCQACGEVMAVHFHNSYQAIKDCLAGMKALCNDCRTWRPGRNDSER